MIFRTIAFPVLASLLVIGCATPLPVGPSPTWLKCKWRSQTVQIDQHFRDATEERRTTTHRVFFRIRVSGAANAPNAYIYRPGANRIETDLYPVFDAETVLLPNRNHTRLDGDYTALLNPILIDRKTLKLREIGQTSTDDRGDGKVRYTFTTGRGVCRIIPQPPLADPDQQRHEAEILR
jgi:hypothetical protein